MDLNRYMQEGIRSIAGTVSAFYLTNPKGLKFLAGFLPALKKSADLRKRHEEAGLHVPPFLIASIASQCNLRCAGCYARAGGLCGEEPDPGELTPEEWERVFREAAGLGVSFLLLAGGEPLLRREVVERAAAVSGIAFPVFTNGLLLEGDILDLFDRHRNLIPVLSLEGDPEQTDRRRGAGVSQKLEERMEAMRDRGMLYAVSVTLTAENAVSAVSEEMLTRLREKGCGVVFYVEYVPAQPGTDHLMLSEKQAEEMRARLETLRQAHRDMTLLAFPGDEKYMDGCLAAGRGFFHINPTGGAEPCPFSPFSACNVKEQSLKQALASPFFTEVRAISRADAGHSGGCTLFNHEPEIRRLLQNQE